MWKLGLQLLLVATLSAAGGQLGPQSAEFCPPLPEPTGNVVTVDSVTALVDAVNTAQPGDTILVADGTYDLDGAYLWIDTEGVTLRSASGNRDAVTLDGGYTTTEIVTIAASDVTIADLTLFRAHTHPIHVVSEEGDTTGTLIYNVHVVDPREQAIKINPNTAGTYPDAGVVACSHLELTDAGRPHVNPASGGCYTGGIDAHQARGWVIRDNLIEGFWCPSGLAEHAVHLWRGSRDTIVERNALRNNARGVGFGMATSGDARTYADDPCPGITGYVGHYGGTVRNNAIFAGRAELFASNSGFDCGICIWQACGATVVHNTVAATEAPFSSIEWRFSNTTLTLTNNLVTHAMREREGATAVQAGNVEGASLALFADGAAGDLHLAPSASAAIDQGVAVAGGIADADFDGDARPIGPARDVGADEWGVAPPAAVTDLRVTRAVVATDTITLTLRWFPPADAVTTTLRRADAPITAVTWDAATVVAGGGPGSPGIYTATLPHAGGTVYTGGTIYFALRTANAQGAQSALSNNAFWPARHLYLPTLLK